MARTATRTRTPTPDQSDTIQALKAQLEAKNAEIARLRVPPVAPRNLIDSGNFQIGPGDGDVHMDPEGGASLQMPDIEVQTKPLHKEKADELKFMEELVTVRVAETSDPNEGVCVSFWNGGVHQLLIRGENVTCKRKFLERLARCKTETFANVEFQDEAGIKRIKWPKRTGQRYPFSVIRDDNPRGSEWLRQVLMEP